MYLVHTPNFVRTFFSEYLWHIDTQEKCIYLTFDDGPIEELTPWILDTLAQYDAKATFFCVGENVHKNSDIYYRLHSEGHTIGNHTYNHLNGWNTDVQTYMENVQRCDLMVSSPLFRPPYGKLKPSQSAEIRKSMQIVMWDILSGDFDASLSKEDCYSNIVTNYSKGSIIVLHDNIKSEEKVKYVLPKLLDHLYSRGYRCENLDCLVTADRMTII
ncbi:MAG: polysaccharide deacetylase family protein [Saprospiraceae bacterium]